MGNIDITNDGVKYRLNKDTNEATVLGLSDDNKSKHIIIKNNINEKTDYSVLYITNEAFNQTLIESITIPNSVKIIGDRAFNSVSTLKIININEESDLEMIGNSAFFGTSIENVIIPKKVNKIQGGAFSNMKKLKKVIFKGDKPDIEPYTFSETVNIFSNPPLGYVDKKQYPAWNGVNFIDDLVVNKVLHIVIVIPILLIILFVANIYLYVKSSTMNINIIVGVILGAIIGMGFLSKQIYFVILLFLVPYLLSIYNLFNKKFSLHVRVPLALLLFVLYKYKLNKLI